MINPQIYNREQTLSFMKKSGLDLKELEVWVRKFVSLRSIAPKRGVSCSLKLSQYVRLAVKAGLTSPKQIGKSPGSYQMGRIGDLGDYAWGNCRFITQEQNIAERKQNGGDAAIAEKHRGRTKHTHTGLKTISEKLSKSFIIRSPHGKVYRGSNLTEFCKKHDLQKGALSLVCRGLAQHTKGWTGEYAE